MLSPDSCVNYFKMGSATRRYSVIGCLGYESANPSCISSSRETVDVGVGCDHDHYEHSAMTCAVCLENIDVGSNGAPQKNVATTECGHTFCLSCLLTNLHNSNLCPLCRAPIEKNVKQVLKPLSYSDGIGLLNHELNALRIMEDVEQFVQNAMEISSQPNTNGQNVEDVISDLMNMVTDFGFNLLYDATLHTNGGEEQHMDQEWILQMYNHNDDDDDDDDDGDDSTTNDYNSDSESDDSESESESPDSDDDEKGDGDTDESKNKRVVLPEVPQSMLE